ncbi:MAG TPA: Lrp/AsnC ligand binding domain-containing protein [Gammaproteobacteria bacterium]|nr:Lrp/AsnC ligand binding domain-containing protein [Gammaproteobacteria bacterium]
MVTAIVLLNVDRHKVNDVAERLAEMQGISEAYSVSGRYDIIAIIRAGTNGELADLVTRHMLKLDGITGSETLLAFRAYSRHDLESMFSVGLGEA